MHQAIHRRLNFRTNRASVRRWALQNQLAPDTRYKAPPKPVKRWQARDWGALLVNDNYSSPAVTIKTHHAAGLPFRFVSLFVVCL